MKILSIFYLNRFSTVIGTLLVCIIYLLSTNAYTAITYFEALCSQFNKTDNGFRTNYLTLRIVFCAVISCQSQNYINRKKIKSKNKANFFSSVILQKKKSQSAG